MNYFATVPWNWQGNCKGNESECEMLKSAIVCPTLTQKQKSRKSKPGLSKPCLWLSDTRHFRHFRRFRGSEERKPCFQCVECSLPFSPFSSKRPLFDRDKNTVYQKHGLCHPQETELHESHEFDEKRCCEKSSLKTIVCSSGGVVLATSSWTGKLLCGTVKCVVVGVRLWCVGPVFSFKQ